MMARSPARTRGFTLLEVLIALAVLSLALIGLIRAAGLGVNAHTRIREQTLAMWVAQNVVSELRLRSTIPSIGQQSGDMRMGTNEWRWEAEIESTPEPNLRRIEVKVFDASDMSAPRASLSGFVGSP